GRAISVLMKAPSSWPGLIRSSTRLRLALYRLTWIPGTRPGMTPLGSDRIFSDSALIPWRCGGLRPWVGGALAGLFFEPQGVVFLGPIEVDGAGAHRLEGAFHAERADIDVREHRGDEQHRDDAVGHFGFLHRLDRRAVEREDQHIAADGNRAAAQHNDPIHQLFTRIKP